MKKIVVAPASGKPVNLDAITVKEMMQEFHVPKSIFEYLKTFVPDFIQDGLKKFCIGVPILDREKNIMKMRITVNGENGSPDTIVKLQISMVKDKPHRIKISTDGGETFRELSYTVTKDDEGEEEVVAPNPSKRGRPRA